MCIIMSEHIVNIFHDLKYMGSLPIRRLDQDNHADLIRVALGNSNINSFCETSISLVVALEGIRTYYSESKSLHMLHALRRISFATCDPEKFHFGFVARQPKQQWDEQLCHLFLTKTQKQAEQLNHVVGEVFRIVYSSQLRFQLNIRNSKNQSKPISDEKLASTIHHQVEKYVLCPSVVNSCKNDNGPESNSREKLNDLIDFQPNSNNNNEPKPTMKYLLHSSYNQSLKKFNCTESDDDEHCPLFDAKSENNETATVSTPIASNSNSFLNIVQNLNNKRMSTSTNESSSSSSSSSTTTSTTSTLAVRSTSSSADKDTTGSNPTIDSSSDSDELGHLKKASWFQAGIPREISADVLKREPIGSFIVRESTTKPGCYALSLRVPKSHNILGIVHYLILRTPKGYKIKGFTKEFVSLTSLIIHHSVMQELLPCPLLLPKAKR